MLGYYVEYNANIDGYLRESTALILWGHLYNGNTPALQAGNRGSIPLGSTNLGLQDRVMVTRHPHKVKLEVRFLLPLPI